PLVDSPPPPFSTLSIPPSTTQPLAGKASSFAPLHPFVVLPSHKSFQPSLFSLSEMVLDDVFICTILSELSGLLYFSRSSVRMRILLQLTVLPSKSLLFIECTCNAINPLAVTSSIISEAGTPLTHVRSEFPIASIRAL